jgi:hypothetical protein
MHRQGGELWFNQATNALAELWEGDCELTPEHFKGLCWALINMNQALQMSLADIHIDIQRLPQQPQTPALPRAPWILPNR